MVSNSNLPPGRQKATLWTVGYAARTVELDAALSQAMFENGVEEAYRATVKSLLERADDDWRRCCGESCNPCSLTLGRVVDRVRALIAR
jgi:hypothetical protein